MASLSKSMLSYSYCKSSLRLYKNIIHVNRIQPCFGVMNQWRLYSSKTIPLSSLSSISISHSTSSMLLSSPPSLKVLKRLRSGIKQEYLVSPFMPLKNLQGEDEESIRRFIELREYCYDLSCSYKLVIFLNGTPTDPGDFSSELCLKILYAAGLNTELFESAEEPYVIPNTGKVKMKPSIAYFDVNNNGPEYKDLFRYGLRGIKNVPFVYINGIYAGDIHDLSKLYHSGRLQALMKEHSVNRTSSNPVETTQE